MSKLQAPLHTLLDEPISELQVQRIWRNAQAPSEPRWKHKRMHLWLLAAAIVVVLLTRYAL